MKKKQIDIDEITAITSRNHIQEKRPFRLGFIILIFIIVLILLIICFIEDELFSINQMSFLGIFGASALSFFTIILTLNHEKRFDYIVARKSALMLSEILDSLYSQIERIKNDVMENLRKENALRTGPYWYIAVENRAMLATIFAVYLKLKAEDSFKLCWGELSLKPIKEIL